MTEENYLTLEELEARERAAQSATNGGAAYHRNGTKQHTGGGNGPRTRRDFGTLAFDDVDIGAEPEWLVDGWLPTGALMLLYGDPGCGKSFVTSDLALAIAAGGGWHGRDVRQGGVAYIAAEGQAGFKKRLVAYRQKFSVTGLPFALIPTSVDLCTDKTGAIELEAELLDIAEAMGQPLRLVVLDTLARSMGSGDENAAKDMGALIESADRIRHSTGAAVLLVHHAGKDRAKGARGHSSLYGAVDTAIEVTAAESGLRTAKTVKQKDGDDGLTFCFSLEPVTVASVPRLVTSCTVRAEAAPEQEAAPAGRRLSGVNAIALAALQRAVEDHGVTPPATPNIPTGIRAVSWDLWRLVFYKMRSSETPDANQKAFRRASTDLQSRGILSTWGDQVWLV